MPRTVVLHYGIVVCILVGFTSGRSINNIELSYVRDLHQMTLWMGILTDRGIGSGGQ